MKLVLSNYGIKDLSERLDFLKSDIEDACVEIVNELINKGSSEALRLDASVPHSSTKPNTAFVQRAKCEDNSIRGKVGLQGSGIIYDEFGTGEEGASDAHPWKWQTASGSKLNPYNSGPIVSKNINKYGRHYWFYTPMAGSSQYYAPNGYTEGIPSGKQMYNTAKMLQKEKKMVAKPILNRYLSKYN